VKRKSEKGGVKKTAPIIPIDLGTGFNNFGNRSLMPFILEKSVGQAKISLINPAFLRYIKRFDEDIIKMLLFYQEKRFFSQLH
jgi:hypothetical protein